jgi:hypothetical protein
MNPRYPSIAQIGRNGRNNLDFIGVLGRNRCVVGMVSVTTCFSRISGLVTTVTTYSPSDRSQMRQPPQRGGWITTKAALRSPARHLGRRFSTVAQGERA